MVKLHSEQTRCRCGGPKSAKSARCHRCACDDKIKPRPERQCVVCGVMFPVTRDKAKHQACKWKCAHTLSNRSRKPKYPLDEARARRNAANRARSAIVAAGVGWGVINRSTVCDRDGWACWICGQRIPQDLKFPDRLSGSVDHVVPLALGGHHGWDNVKAAHLRCNSRRGGRLSVWNQAIWSQAQAKRDEGT